MSTPTQWISSAKLKDLFDDVFDRDGNHGATSFYSTPINVAMGFVQYLEDAVDDGIVIADNRRDGRISAAAQSNSIFPWDQAHRIQEQLIGSMGQIHSFQAPRAKSVYFVSDPGTVQHIKGVRINCECNFEGTSKPVELTMVFDEEDTAYCLYFSAADHATDNIPTLIFATQDDTPDTDNTDNDHLEMCAKYIVYEMSLGHYETIQELYGSSHQVDLNFQNFRDEFAGCVFSSITWGATILTPIADGRQMVNLSVTFDRQNRTPFDRRLLLIFNHEHRLEMIDFFVD